uniref:Uncharacterized protein n=1 Tax=Arundo donax TaxID=35708 RepID=A0A0A8ZVF3_ARUDO
MHKYLQLLWMFLHVEQQLFFIWSCGGSVLGKLKTKQTSSGK